MDNYINYKNLGEHDNINNEMEEAERLISFAIKNGFLYADPENWTDEEKLDYYHKCLEYEI